MAARLVSGGGGFGGKAINGNPSWIYQNQVGPSPVAPPPPYITPPPAPSGGSGGGGYSSGGGGGGYNSYSSSGGDYSGGGGAGSFAAAAPAVTQDQYINSDAAYQAQLAALTKALTNYQADNTAQSTKYNTDYGTSLKNLGWSGAADGAVDDPSTPFVDESKGAWNLQDQNTAAGRAYENQQNDFGSRGLLQSSLYGEANNNLMRSLGDQLTGLDTAKSNFMSDLARQLTSYQDQNTAQQQQAKADSLARYAATYGV